MIGAKLIPRLLAGFALLVAACDNQVEPTEVEASGSTLCVADYETCVNPILDAAINGKSGVSTCSASGCHSQAAGSGGAFKIYAGAQPGSEEMLANFFSARAFANLDDPESSKLILEPREGQSSITGTHTGGDIFPGAADACDAAMVAWISKRVEDEESTVCGGCSVPATASCGY